MLHRSRERLRRAAPKLWGPRSGGTLETDDFYLSSRRPQLLELARRSVTCWLYGDRARVAARVTPRRHDLEHTLGSALFGLARCGFSATASHCHNTICSLSVLRHNLEHFLALLFFGLARSSGLLREFSKSTLW